MDNTHEEVCGKVKDMGNQGTNPVASKSYPIRCYIFPGQATCWGFVGNGIVAGITRSMACI